MRIESETVADVVALVVRKGKDSSECYVDLEIGVAQAEAMKEWGDEFESLAFSSMRVRDVGDLTSTTFLVDTVKPKVVYELHEVELGGITLKVQPELRTIKTVPGDAMVVAHIRLPISGLVMSSSLGELGEMVNSTADVSFKPAQLELGLVAQAG